MIDQNTVPYRKGVDFVRKNFTLPPWNCHEAQFADRLIVEFVRGWIIASAEDIERQEAVVRGKDGRWELR